MTLNEEQPKGEEVMDNKGLGAADPSDADDPDDITWLDVLKGCCCHSPIGWFWIIFRLFWVTFFLYFFIVGLDILGAGAGVFTGCVAGELFGDDQNPVTGLMVGIILTGKL
jgi:solute carrier family 34 (sodium-dependent phosphate cotransporter)